jgi:glycosyltransferase involved in cell wall biosynthesis
MRILVLTHEYPPIGGGGGRVAQDICAGLAKRGHEIRILTAHHGDLPTREQEGSIQIQRLRSGRRQPFKADMRAMLGYVLMSFLSGLGVIRRWKPEVIHVHFAVPAGACAWALSILSGTPYVLTAHLGDVPGGVPQKTDGWFCWVFPLTPPIWRRAAQVVAVSEFTRRLALDKYPVPVQVIPNGVDLGEIHPGEIEIGKPPQIVFAGRFTEQKNPVQLVRTLGELKDLSWNCTMLGDGTLRGEIEAEITRHDLGERFKLPGWVTPQEVLACFAQSDILFMPSRSEGLPVVGVQAIAMGLAVVLSEVGGNIELVHENENGFLVDRDDFPGFGLALRELLSNEDRLLEARVASRVLASRFDLKDIVAAYVGIFIQACQT